jgi:hypothetical protein
MIPHAWGKGWEKGFSEEIADRDNSQESGGMYGTVQLADNHHVSQTQALLPFPHIGFSQFLFLSSG